MKRTQLVIVGVLLFVGVGIVKTSVSITSSKEAAENIRTNGSSPGGSQRPAGGRDASLKSKEFSQMTRNERQESLHQRLAALSLINDQADLERTLRVLARDVDSLDQFERLGYTEAIEKSLARIPDTPLDKLIWISEFLPTIEKTLAGRKTPFGDSLTQTFSFLATNLRQSDVDVYETVRQMADERSRSKVTANIVPHLFLFTGDQQLDLLRLTSKDDRKNAENEMIKIAASQDALQPESIEMYLSGWGSKESSNAISSFFDRPDWFLKNPANLAGILNAKGPSSRKNQVIGQMVKVMSRSSSEDAISWANEITEPDLRRKALEAIEKNRN